ncbi:MAG TPA: serine/threonine-protein kinase [Kofleriaceae bacterium]
MTCPAENTWMRYVGGALEPVSVNAIEQHLDTCESCRFMFVNLAKGSANDATQPQDGTDATQPAQHGTDPTVPAKLARFDLLAPHELVRGSLVDRYVILGTLGRGGMGVVYKAFDPDLDRPIALKLVAVGNGSDADDSRARLVREAKTLAQLSHPNVVAVHDVGSHDRDVFVAMEFVAGRTLRAWLQDNHSPRDILAVFRAAGAGLAAAHRLGIVHRDFKPENVMVGDDGRVRVLDFGLARPGQRSVARPSLPSISAGQDADLTRAGAIMGTPAYMAPEQDLGNEVDGRSDQFSFCASLYEALYRQRPFLGYTYAEIADRRLAGEVQPVSRVRGVSSRIRRALLRGLRVDPAERNASMDALLVELGGPRKRTKLALAALALTTLGAGGWATWVTTHEAPSTDELCATSASEIERIWNPARRAALIKSFERLGARDTALQVTDRFDRYAADWTSRRAGVCKQMVDGDRVRNHDDHVSSRMQCLRSRLIKLDATVTVMIEAPTEPIVKRAGEVVDELPPLAPCDGNDSTPVVTDEIRDRWTPVVKELVEAQTALATGKLEEAERLARQVVERAKAIDDVEPIAAAMMLLGRIQTRNGTPAAEAKATLLEAVRAATAAREETTVVEAWSEILGLAFTNRTMLAELDDEIFAAEVAALRLSDDSPRRTELAYRLGSVQLLRGEMDAALPKLEVVLAAYQREPEKYKYEIAAVQNSLGAAHTYRGDFAKGRSFFEHSYATWDSILFPHPNLATTIGWFGELAVLQHDYAGALPHYERQVELFGKLGKAGHAQLGKARFQLAYTHARNGQCDKALPLFAQARDELIAQHGKATAFVGLTLLGEGHCALAAGNRRKAISLLERAATLTTPAATLLQSAYTDFTLARALVKRDNRRAIALAERARDRFARFPGARADRQAVEAWLAAQR